MTQSQDFFHTLHDIHPEYLMEGQVLYVNKINNSIEYWLRGIVINNDVEEKKIKFQNTEQLKNNEWISSVDIDISYDNNSMDCIFFIELR